MRLLVASNNGKKLAEIKKIVSFIGIEAVSPSELGLSIEVEEDGATFEENALIKAMAAAAAAGCPAFADDSGLVVDALGGRPGIHSARYAGPEATDAQRVDKLLSELNGVTDRRASFVCVVALACPDGGSRTFRGEIEGEITSAPAGAGGFGYDPVFRPLGHQGTFAELPVELKNKISHRAKALGLAMDELARLAKGFPLS